MGILNFLLSWDQLGYSPSLSYKGEKRHNTMLGAVLSLSIKTLVVIQLYQKLVSLIDMDSPSIQSY